MAMITLIKPAVEPLDIVQVTPHIKVDGLNQTTLVSMQISAARQRVETFIRQRLITQTVQLTFDSFTNNIQIPIWPVQSIDKVTYLDNAGVTQTLAPTDYQLVTSRKPYEIAPAYLKVWPTMRSDYDAVNIDVVVGYGDRGSEVPPDILQAILLTVGDYFQFRENTVDTPLSTLPNGVKDILKPYIFWV